MSLWSRAKTEDFGEPERAVKKLTQEDHIKALNALILTHNEAVKAKNLALKAEFEEELKKYKILATSTPDFDALFKVSETKNGRFLTPKSEMPYPVRFIEGIGLKQPGHEPIMIGSGRWRFQDVEGVRSYLTENSLPTVHSHRLYFAIEVDVNPTVSNYSIEILEATIEVTLSSGRKAYIKCASCQVEQVMERLNEIWRAG